MELFGYVCSPLCRAKAGSHGITVPVYARQKSIIEAKRSRHIGQLGWAVAILTLGTLSLWVWFSFWGSVPKTIFSVRFELPARSGESRLCVEDQIVFLHGGTLARYNLKQQKQVWSRSLLDKQQISEAVEREMKATKAAIDHANMVSPDHTLKMPDPEKITQSAERTAAAAMDLRVSGKNIWVASPGKLVRYDWETGTPAKEIALGGGLGRAIPRGDELLFLEENSGKPSVRHVNLNTCESRVEDLGATSSVAGSTANQSVGSVAKLPGNQPTGSRNVATVGLPVGRPGKDAGKQMDPAKVAEQAQHLPLAAKIALPAVLAANYNQERALNELNDRPSGSPPPAGGVSTRPDSLQLLPTKDGFVQFSTRMLEKNIVLHSAMKAPSGKSALEGAVTVSKSTEVANEILNDMQRSRGGDVVQEDLSRYLVTLEQPAGQDLWTGEVVGPPNLYPLQTIRVLGAGKTITVFDRANRKLWQNTLSYNLAGGTSEVDEEGGSYGAGPCVEHDDSLYVFDQGVLTAFERGTGNVRWRLPSVGVAGLFFDDKNMMYVNTTTASLEKLKYSRQIDISQKATSIVLKIDPRTGKVLWTSSSIGLLTYVSGKYLYSVQSYQPEEEESPYVPETGFETQPYLRIRRINPRNGQALWEHFQQRAPLDVHFDENKIELVFKKEVQVLKFLSL
jgi:hypothetical protein